MNAHRNKKADESYKRGLASLDSGQLEQALAIFREVIADNPSDEESWAHFASAIQRLGNEKEAESALAGALNAGVRSKQFWYTLANCMHGERSQQAYLMALAVDPQDEQVLGELAWSLRTSGFKDQALEIYRRLLEIYSRKKDAPSLNSLGDTLRRLVGSYDDAENAFERALELEPESFETWKGLCYLMCSRREPALAQQIMRRFIQSYPEHPQRAEAWVCLGTVLKSLDDYNGAEEAVRQALGVDPLCQAAWSKLADILFETGSIAEAQQALKRANDLDYNKRFDGTTDDTGASPAR